MTAILIATLCNATVFLVCCSDNCDVPSTFWMSFC
jgi:hypothetical protein